MSVFESDAYKLAKSEESQSTSQYSPFQDSQFNYLNDINSGVYASTGPSLVQWDLTSIMSHAAFTSVEDLYVTVPLVTVAQYVTTAGAGVAPTSAVAGQIAGGVLSSGVSATGGLGLSSGLVTLKSSYHSLVHQCELSVGGKVVSDLQPFTNIINGFKLASTMNASSDLKSMATTLGISDTGLDNEKSVVFNTVCAPASDGPPSSGCGLTNNRPFVTTGGIPSLNQQSTVGGQNQGCANDAIQKRIAKIVDTSKAAANGVYGISSGDGTLGLTIMNATELATEAKSYSFLSGTQMVWFDTAILPLKYLMDVVDKLPMMKRTDMLLRMYFNVGSMIVPVVQPAPLTSNKLQFFPPQSSTFQNTCPFTVNWLDTAVPATTAGIAVSLSIAKSIPTSLSVTPLAGFTTPVAVASINLGTTIIAHPQVACRCYFNQISMTPESEEQYILSNTNKPVVYERFIYNQFNGTTKGGNFSQLIASGVKNPLSCLIIPFISNVNKGVGYATNLASAISATQSFPTQYGSCFDTCGGISFAPISLTNLQVSVGMKNVLQNSLFFSYDAFLQQVCEYESISGNKLDILNRGIYDKQWWEMNRVYFVNLARGSPADRATPRNIQVSFSNNSEVTIDVMIFITYADRIVVDVRTGIVS